MKTYLRPPITEAIIQLNFADILDRKGIERAADAFGKEYARQDEAEISLKIELGHVSQAMKPAGIRLTNSALQQNIIIRENSIIVGRLAPYPGWDLFFAEVWDAFRAVRRRLGYRKVTRVGMRYVNRIDIPYQEDNSPPNWREYVRSGFVDLPLLGMTSPTNYLAQGDFFPPGGWAKVVVRTATAQPVLIRHLSLLLDFDVFVDVDVPQSEVELEKLFERLRDLKNEVFMACITPKAEALFEAPI